MIEVIAFAGMGRAGKTECTKVLAGILYNVGYSPRTYSFAEPLKTAVANDNGYQTWQEMKEKEPEKYRQQCQSIGESKRAKDPDHWVSMWYSAVSDDLEVAMRDSISRVILVDDCRYLNEVDAVHSLGGHVSLVCAGARLPDPDGIWRSHESEYMANQWTPMVGRYQMPDGVNSVVNNSMHIGRLKDRLEDLMVLWDFPGETMGLDPNNPFVDPYVFDYKSNNRLDKGHLGELMDYAGFSRESIRRYVEVP